MKRHVFIDLKERVKLGSIGKFITGSIIAIFLGWLVYPEYSLTKVTGDEVTVIDKVGNYTYYSYKRGSKVYTYSEKGEEKREIGDKFISRIKAKDHPKYSSFGRYYTNVTILVFYTLFSVILFFTLMCEGDISERGYGFMITTIIINIIILILWWI